MFSCHCLALNSALRSSRTSFCSGVVCPTSAHTPFPLPSTSFAPIETQLRCRLLCEAGIVICNKKYELGFPLIPGRAPKTLGISSVME